MYFYLYFYCKLNFLIRDYSRLIVSVFSSFLQQKRRKKIFICGIGGIGTSGLAILAKSCGYYVYGSNNESNSNTEKLKQLGIDVKIGHKADNIGDCDIFVYTRAIDLSTNIEAIEAKARQIEIYERGAMLSILMLDYYNIVIAGSHGKTTTTGLIGNMLDTLGDDPNILIGGVLNKNHSNCKISKRKYFVVESDESDGSFLGMPTNIGIITNIDPEHMEFYKTVDNLEYYFYRFAKKIIDNNGYVIICIDDKIGYNVFKKIGEHRNVITYGMKEKSVDFYCNNIVFEKNGLSFDVYNNLTNTSEKKVFLKNMFGKINASNTLPAFAVGYILEKKSNEIAKTFASFSGIEKRFTIVGTFNDTIVVDDYAHNPQKINSAIDSARHYMKCNNLNGKLTIIFEPHRYTRVRDGIELFSDFLKKSDNVIVLPIYSSSEREIEGITQEFVVSECKKKNCNVYKCDLDIKNIKSELIKIGACGKDNLIVFMGAGRSSKKAHELVEVIDDYV